MIKNRVRLTESQLHRVIKESLKNVLKEGDVRFIPHLQKDIETLHSLYEKWQYAENKPEGIDDFIDAVLNAKHIMEDIKSSLADCEY